MLVPKRWPQFPGRGLWAFLGVWVFFYFAMLGEIEYKIERPKTTYSAGNYTFDVENKGKIPHNLTITGPRISKEATQDISAGSSSTVSVKLQPGTYDFYCSIPRHKAQGMDQ